MSNGPKAVPVTGEAQHHPTCCYAKAGDYCYCAVQPADAHAGSRDETRPRTSDAFSERDCAACGLPHPMDPCAARSVAIDEGLAIGLGIDTKDVDGHRFYTLDELCRVRAFALQEGLERGAAAIVGVTNMAMAILHRPCGTGGCVRFQTTGACWKVKR